MDRLTFIFPGDIPRNCRPFAMTYPSPAYDINGNLVTVDLEGGDYANLPEGYYTTPGMAAVARAGEQQTGTPLTAQQVGAIYSNPSPDAQDAIQEIFDAPPPPSDYVAPTPPAAIGWVAPTPTAPPTAAEIIAQTYLANGYLPPSAAVIAQIISGEIVAPLTTPLPAAPQNSVDAILLPGQTAASPPPQMSAIYHDTAAFQIGNQSGAAVMQLVDADGHLVQWTVNVGGSGYLVAPFYVTTAPAKNEKRLVGADMDGNPVFQLIDNAGNLLQWTENKGQTDFVVAPFYVSAGAAASAGSGNAPGSVATGTTTPSGANGGAQTGGNSLARPTIQVGRTPAGLAIKQLVDDAGIVKQWIELAGGGYFDLVNAQTYGTLFPTANTAAQATTPGSSSPLAKPQIQVGTTSKGWKIYQITDEAGVTKQWIIDPGPPSRILDLVNVPTYGVLYHDSVTDAVLSGGGTVTQDPPFPVDNITAATNSIEKALIGIAIALVFALGSR